MASTEMEHLKQTMRHMMEIGFTPKFDGELDATTLRNTVEKSLAFMAVAPGVSFLPKTYAGVECEWSLPENAQNDYLVFYIHGGGMVCGNAVSSRGYASILAAETKRQVLSISYRLAPEHPYPAGLEDCFAVYQELLKEHPDTPIFLIGESGGAYLSIAVAMMARDKGVRLPAGIVPYSPPIAFIGAIDREFEGNEDFTVRPSGMDWIGGIYVGEAHKGEIYAEPYYDDFHGMPPTFLAWDANESLSVDSEIAAEKLRAQGIEVEAYRYPHCFHAFATVANGTPESAEILANTIRFFEKHK